MHSHNLGSDTRQTNVTSQPVYQEYQLGIYYCVNYTPNTLPPKKINIAGRIYTRFMNFIYMPCETHELTREQCIAVNDLRSIFFEKHADKAVNFSVKKRIASLINTLCAGTQKRLLEYGCGHHTLFDFLDTNIDYTGVDISLSAIEKQKAKNAKGNYLVINDALPIKDQSIDILVSVFVFHFQVTQFQLAELYRILDKNGVMIFNLYLLSQELRKTLFLQLTALGFTYHREIDRDAFCQNHEYCFLATNPNSALYKRAVKLYSSHRPYWQNGLFASGSDPFPSAAPPSDIENRHSKLSRL